MFSKILLKRSTALLGGLIMILVGLGAPMVMSAEDAQKSSNAQAVSSDKGRTITLSNGFTVYILPDKRFPLVSSRLFVKVGAAHENMEEAGMAHALEHMVFKSTAKRKVGEISEEIEGLGGSLNALTIWDYTRYEIDLPSKHWAIGLDILQDMLFNPLLDEAELAAEKEVILSEVQVYNDDARSKMFKIACANALKGTRYAHSVLGYEETIKNYTPQSMRNFMKKYYQPQNMLLVVVGNIDADAVFAEVEKLFGGFKNTEHLLEAPPVDAAALRNASVSIEEGNWNKVYISIALPTPGYLDDRSIALNVLGYALGGSNTSYLYRKYKHDKQLVDYVFAEHITRKGVGMFYFLVELEAKNVPIFWKEFITDLATLKAIAFSEKDLARALLDSEDYMHRVKEKISGIANDKGFWALYLGAEQGEKNYLTGLAAVNHKLLQNAIDSWLRPESLNVAVFAPKGTKLPDLKAELHKIWPVKQQADTQAKAKASGERKIIELGEGRTVIFIHDNTIPYTNVQLALYGGDNLTNAEGKEQGLASLTAAMLTSGTKTMTAPQIKEYLADRSAKFGASSSRKLFWLTSSQPSRFNDDIFTLFQQVLKQPSMLEEEIVRTKNNQKARIRSRDEDAFYMAFYELMPFLYGTHPYGYKSLGELEDVDKYSRQDIVTFWDKQKKQPWVLTVAGDFDEESVLAFARSLPVPSGKKREITTPTWGKEKKLELKTPGRDQAHHMLVFKSVTEEHPDAPALRVLEAALDGMGGLLFKQLRDKEGLAYTVYAYQYLYAKAGFFYLYIGTDPKKLEQAHASFEKIIAGLKTTLLDEKTLHGAKNQIEGSYYREIQTLTNRAYEAVSQVTFNREQDFKKKFIAKTKDVSAEDVQRVAQKYLKDAYTVTVKP